MEAAGATLAALAATACLEIRDANQKLASTRVASTETTGATLAALATTPSFETRDANQKLDSTGIASTETAGATLAALAATPFSKLQMSDATEDEEHLNVVQQDNGQTRDVMQKPNSRIAAKLAAAKLVAAELATDSVAPEVEKSLHDHQNLSVIPSPCRPSQAHSHQRALISRAFTLQRPSDVNEETMYYVRTRQLHLDKEVSVAQGAPAPRRRRTTLPFSPSSLAYCPSPNDNPLSAMYTSKHASPRSRQSVGSRSVIVELTRSEFKHDEGVPVVEKVAKPHEQTHTRPRSVGCKFSSRLPSLGPQTWICD
jgi:hypothetical protein